MDNETPNYAEWINEAGGYVANGNVVSKSPIYEEDGSGRMKIKVDASVFGNTQPQNSKAQPQVANQTATNVGITTANTKGSGTDANAAMTQAGSLGSLNLNTANTDNSAISSPATKSNIAGSPALSPTDEVNREYQDAVGRGDLQGQINALTKASRLTGADYSAEINNLTQQRQQKIQGIDDQYLQAINEAKAIGDQTGDYTQYNQLIQDQNTWRNQVGYRDAMQQQYQMKMQEIDVDYKGTWLQAANDIGAQLIQALPGILNFQYDPYSDKALNIAQGYATSQVKEQMNSTGMYYSSMTQNAITKAVAELVPVYEKMARQEAIENFNLLQQTAGFLMDLEQTQFNMWKSQIQLKFDANAEKRAEIDQAIQNANARGYYTNEEAALLGVEPGTESYESRTRALDKQEQIEKEQRQLQQNMTLAQFNSELAVQEYAQKQAIAAQYEIQTYGQKQAIAAQYATPGTNSKNKLSLSELKSTLKGMKTLGYSQEDLVNFAINNAQNGADTAAAMASVNAEKLANRQKNYPNLKGTELLTTVSNENLLERYNDDRAKLNSGRNISVFLGTLNKDTADDKAEVISDMVEYANGNVINDITSNFGKDQKKTQEAVADLKDIVSGYSTGLKNSGLSDDGQLETLKTLYENISSKIDSATDFKYNGGKVESMVDAKNAAKKDIVNAMTSGADEKVRVGLQSYLDASIANTPTSNTKYIDPVLVGVDVASSLTPAPSVMGLSNSLKAVGNALSTGGKALKQITGNSK